jgi:hypothetical protein
MHPIPKSTANAWARRQEGSIVKLKLSADVPLDAFVRRASQLAEQALDRDGGLDPSWIAITSTGERHILYTPIPDRASKDAVAIAVREYFAKHDVVRFAFICEASAPDGREIVLIRAEDLNGYMTATREIIRPQGRRPHLGQLDIDRIADGGRFTNLLTQRTVN